MAIWTFDFHIIPKDKFSADSVKYGDIDSLISWIGFSVHDGQINKLSLYFPHVKNWNSDTIQLGESESTNIQLFTENNNILEISCSMDLRSITISEIEVIVNFMQNIKSAIFYKNHAYDVSMHNIINLIKQSNAFAFCKNPRAYIEHLSN